MRDGHVRDTRPGGDTMTVRDEARATYPIRAVSKLTGISIDTLRAWERRYNAVTPLRDDRGRVYTGADVARLRSIHAAVASGHAIGRVARLTDNQLRQLAEDAAPSPLPAPAVSTRGEFGDALARFDSAAVERELARLASVLPPTELVRDVVLPALAAVGDEWNERPGGIAREHLMSAAVRNMFGSFLRLHARAETGSRLLFATPAGDRHELGTLGAALLAASRGFTVSYLGPDLPSSAILDAVRAVHEASVLVLGITLPGRGVGREVRSLVKGLPRGVELWTGGAGAHEYAGVISPRGLVLPDFDAYVGQLSRLEGRVA